MISFFSVYIINTNSLQWACTSFKPNKYTMLKYAPQPEQESMQSRTQMLNRSGVPEIKMVIAFKFKMWAITISFLDIHRNSRTELHLWMRQYSFFSPISWFLSLDRICFSIYPAFHFSMVVISCNYGKKVFLDQQLWD